MIYLVQFSKDMQHELKQIAALYEIVNVHKYYVFANENQLFLLSHIEWAVEAVNQDPSAYTWES